jgi:hypothetical protein
MIHPTSEAHFQCRGSAHVRWVREMCSRVDSFQSAAGELLGKVRSGGKPPLLDEMQQRTNLYRYDRRPTIWTPSEQVADDLGSKILLLVEPCTSSSPLP